MCEFVQHVKTVNELVLVDCVYSSKDNFRFCVLWCRTALIKIFEFPTEGHIWNTLPAALKASSFKVRA